MTKKHIFKGLLFAVIAFLLYQCYVFLLKPSDNVTSFYLVPKDAVYIIESNEPIKSWHTVSSSDIWKHVQKNSYVNSLSQSLIQFDSIFVQQKEFLDILDGRQLLISAHTYDYKKYDFLYVFDLEKLSRLKLIKNNINTLLGESFKVTKRIYKSHDILEFLDPDSNETLYLSFIKNQLIASYANTLIENSINEYISPTLGTDVNFTEIKQEIGSSDLFRVYLQYNQLESFLKIYSNTPSPIAKTLSDNLDYSGFHFNLEDNVFTAKGYTNTKDNITSYLTALKKSGTSSRSIYSIAPKETALYLSFGFKDFSTFYTNFESIQKQKPEAFKTYNSNLYKIEKFLDIDIKQQFIRWIDDEIAILKVKLPNASKNNMALVLKANDIGVAQTELTTVLSKIKKRSPVKFKNINYKGYAINYMHIKGFFKLFLGNLFNDFNKPYFTIINDYVVFSDNPNTLKTIINNFIAKNTLNTNADFMAFDEQFENKSSIYLYGNTPYLYNSLYNFADRSSKTSLTKNKDYIVCFSQFGVQFIPENDLFETELIVNYENVDTVKNKYPEPKPVKSTYKNPNLGLDKATIFNIPELFPEDLTAKSYIKKYPNGAKKLEVELKNGLKHGKYIEFHKNGEPKIKGRYRKGAQIGTWKAYFDNGELFHKKEF